MFEKRQPASASQHGSRRRCRRRRGVVFEGDETWNKSDEELIEQGKRELRILGLVDPAKGGDRLRGARAHNQDHSMYTALLTAENIATGSRHDVWSVNVEEEYHEESSADADGSKPATRS